MKLKDIHTLGHYINPDTGRVVTVRKGRKAGYGTDLLFYLFRYQRIYINDADFYGKWRKADR